MRKIFLFCGLLLVQSTLVLSQSMELAGEKILEKDGEDDIARIHIGAVPYLIFSKSTGLYAAYTYKRLAVEYRISYTIPTTVVFLPYHDWNYYQGINHSLILSCRISDSWQIGVMGALRYWWYDNRWILADDTYASSGYAYQVKRTAYMYGKAIGLEAQKDFSFGNFDMALFFGFNYSVYTGSVTYLANNNGYTGNPPYPYTQARSTDWGNIAFGVKLGYRNQ
jgi:hypothetical protein